jgi:hypothetical protein
VRGFAEQPIRLADSCSPPASLAVWRPRWLSSASWLLRDGGRPPKRRSFALRVRFYLDPGGGLPHTLAHGVSEQEAEDVLRRPGEDRPGRDGVRVALGQTRHGRYLRVIYVPEEDAGVFVITAYDLRGKPLRAYRKRMRRG